MKLVLIGGAGVRAVFFTKSLTMLAKDIGIKKFVMYDVNQEKLEIIGKLCKHVIAQRGIDMELEFSNDIEEALVGADYVITTIRVGNDRSRVIDEQIALKHGVIGQETTGPGGFSMAVRTIPVLLDYCEKNQADCAKCLGIQLYQSFRTRIASAAYCRLRSCNRHLRHAKLDQNQNCRSDWSQSG